MIRQNPSFGLKNHITLLVLLSLALILRLGYSLSQDHLLPFQVGGDNWWYLDHGYKLVQGTINGPPPSAPLYLIVPGIAQQLFGSGSASAVIFLRLVQAVLGTATCYFAYRLAKALRDQRAGLLAAGVLAVSPVFVLETAQILTETLYVFLVGGGLTAYVEMVKHPEPSARRYSGIVLVALLFALATLTRAVLLLFPLGLGIHLLLVYGWRQGFKLAAVLLLIYSLVCSVWTIYNWVRWDYPVIGAQGLSAFLFIGAEGWQAPDQLDQNLAQGLDGALPDDPKAQQEVYQDAAIQSITGDIPGWIARRIRELSGAVLQPHGTTFFPGESLKNLAVDWWIHDRTIAGLFWLTNSQQFWPKLAIYVFYYVGLLAGLVGLWISRRSWRIALPLAGFIVYTTLIHFLLDALPRYLFPLSLVWWVFASVGLSNVWESVLSRLRTHSTQQTAIQPGG